MATTITKTAVRKAVGRKPFTATEYAVAVEVTGVTARKHLDRLVSEGKVEVLPEPRRTGNRGRPAAEFRVVQGK